MIGHCESPGTLSKFLKKLVKHALGADRIFDTSGMKSGLWVAYSKNALILRRCR